MFHGNKKSIIKQTIIGMLFTALVVAGITLTPDKASADTVDYITVDKTKTTIEYKVGSTINTQDIYLFVNGSAVSAQASTLPGVTVDQPENASIGSKTVKVTYAGVSTQYTVSIIPKTPSIYSLKKLDYDTIRAFGSTMNGVDGFNFRCIQEESETVIMMGVTSEKTEYNHYYDTASDLKPGTTYTFMVRAYKDVNGERIYGNWSEKVQITLPALTGVDRWRPEIKRQLEAHGVYSKYRENIITNIIQHESGGSQTAGSGRYYVGLLQFGEHWKHNYSKSYFASHDISNYTSDNRLSGSWSLHRVAHLIKYGGGTDALKTHWPSTWDM